MYNKNWKFFLRIKNFHGLTSCTSFPCTSAIFEHGKTCILYRPTIKGTDGISFFLHIVCVASMFALCVFRAWTCVCCVNDKILSTFNKLLFKVR